MQQKLIRQRKRIHFSIMITRKRQNDSNIAQISLFEMEADQCLLGYLIHHSCLNKVRVEVCFTLGKYCFWIKQLLESKSALIFSIFVMPQFVENKIYSKLVFEEGQEAFEKWKNPPVTPLTKIYVFNLTNEIQFLNGKF